MVNLITFAENCQKYSTQENQWKRVQNRKIKTIDDCSKELLEDRKPQGRLFKNA